MQKVVFSIIWSLLETILSALLGTFSIICALPFVSCQLDLEFGVGDDVDLAKRCAGKKVIMVGLPGAFTPT